MIDPTAAPPPEKVLAAMEQAKIGHAVTDRAGMLLYMTDAFAVQGYVEEERIATEPWYRLDHASEARKNMRAEIWRHFVARAAPWQGIVNWHLADGKLRFFEGTASPLENGNIILVLNDRTSKVLADKKVEDTISLYQQILSDLPVAVAVTDLEGKVTYINEFLPRRLNVPTSSFMGRTLTDSFGNDLTALAERVSDTFQPQNRGPEGIIIDLRGPRTGVSTWLVFARPLFNAKSERVGTINVAIDRSESRRLSEEHARLTEAMVEIQKLSALNDFAGNLAHELSNILHPVAFYARRLMTNPDTDKITDYANRINKGVMTAGQILRRTLGLASNDNRKAAPCDIREALAETVASARDLAPQSLTYEMELPKGPVMAEVSPTALRQVLLNLLNNAAEAMRHVGHVSITLETVEEGIPGEIECPAGKAIRLTIADTGPGIDPEIRDRLFDPFVTTKAPGRGTGLGLSVVKGLAANWGGAVTVTAPPEGGTAFSVWIPAPIME